MTEAARPVPGAPERQRQCECGWLLPRDLESLLTLRGLSLEQLRGRLVVNVAVYCPSCGKRWVMAGAEVPF